MNEKPKISSGNHSLPNQYCSECDHKVYSLKTHYQTEEHKRHLRHSTPNQTYWAWYDIQKNKYIHIYRRKFQVEMCSPDGFKKKEEEGLGRLVEIILQEITL